MKRTLTISSFKDGGGFVSVCHEYDFIAQGMDQHDAISSLLYIMEFNHIWALKNPKTTRHDGWNPWNTPYPWKDFQELVFSCAYVDKRVIEYDFDDDFSNEKWDWV